MSADSKNAQVADMCLCVAALCDAMAELHRSLAIIHGTGHANQVLDAVGARCAAIIEELGDTLNGMDAAEDCEHWGPTFRAAHALYPTAWRDFHQPDSIDGPRYRALRQILKMDRFMGAMVMRGEVRIEEQPTPADLDELADLAVARDAAAARAAALASDPGPDIFEDT